MGRLKELNEALPEMIYGDAAILLVGEVIILLFFQDRLPIVIGFLAGVAYAVFAAIHMSFTIERVTFFESKGATARAMGAYFIRLAVMAVLLAGLYYSEVGNIFAALVGMFALKVSALLQPFTHKAIAKFNKKGR